MSHRLILSADWQLGLSRHYLSAAAQADFDTARLDAIQAMGALAREVGAAAILVGGDVFESHLVDRRVVRRAVKVIAALPVPAILLPGNHDPLEPGGLWARAFVRDELGAARIVEDARPFPVAEGLEIVGAPWPSKRPGRDLVREALEGLEAVQPGTHRVLLAHGGLDELVALGDEETGQSVRQADVEAALADGRITLAVFGDRHSLTEVGESGRIVYPGTPEPTAWRETAPGHVVLATLDEEVRLEPRKIGRYVFEERSVAFSAPEDLEDLLAWLEGLGERARRTIVKLRLSGWLDPEGRARLEAGLDAARELLAALEIRDDDLRVDPGRAAGDALEAGGWVAEAARELGELARREDAEGATASDALVQLHRLLVPDGDRAREDAG